MNENFASLNLNADHARDREIRNNGRLFCSRVVSRDRHFYGVGTPRQLRGALQRLFPDRVVYFKITLAYGFLCKCSQYEIFLKSK